jgi:sortase A
VSGSAGGTLRRLVGGLGELLITAGVLLLLFVTWQLWWTDVTANREQAGTIRSLEQDFEDSQHGGLSKPEPDAPAALTEVPLGEAFAIVRIPRFGADYARPVLEGSDRGVLKKGVGHYPGTAMPGQVGNFAVSGHRTTYGRPFHDIDRLRKDDVIVVETRSSFVVYAVDRHVLVRPWQVEVIAPVPERPGATPEAAVMTMTSCHPKYSATQRYVTFSHLVKVIPRSDGLPAEYTAVPAGSVA